MLETVLLQLIVEPRWSAIYQKLLGILAGVLNLRDGGARIVSVPDDYNWVSVWLSPPRWEHYLDYCGREHDLALVLYEWNLELSYSMMHDIAHIEVAIRNIYDQTLSEHWQGEKHWLFDPKSPVVSELWRTRDKRSLNLNERNLISINEARKRINKRSPSPGQIIAELPFGFWRHLTDAAHEKTLWIPYLSRAFPKRTSRKKVESSLKLINMVRNRASHHEPLFTSYRQDEVIQAHKNILQLARLLLPPLENYIRQKTTIRQVLERKPKPRPLIVQR